ncbi:unnamed protein product [Moneuplotes crassus]|uniref:Uncharacterized protein n=1 Tax=Euplotes crassus TaxID=5936 RepID=A0AAD1XKB8_EUPCR|nr:unnamed protein product [Moneuplotes crassus]
MGTCCTKSSHASEQAKKKKSTPRSLVTDQSIKYSKHKRQKKAKTHREEKIDYSDFRNNPILKPAPLDLRQEGRLTRGEMGLSMAAASKQENIKPKEDESNQVVKFGDDMKNLNDTITESQISESTKHKKVQDVIVSFKPTGLDQKPGSLGTFHMSFGGDVLAQNASPMTKLTSTITKESNSTENTSHEGSSSISKRQEA